MHPQQFHPVAPAVSPTGGAHVRINKFTGVQTRLFDAAMLTTTSGWTLGILLLGIYLASLSSISSQIFMSYIGLKLPVIGLAFTAAAMAYLASGQQLAFLKTPFAFPWIALAGWWCVASLFGIYPRGSLDILTGYLLRIHILPLMFVALAVTVRQVRRLMFFFAFGYVLVVLYCFKFGSFAADRFVIPQTTLANSNDLGLHLLLGAAFMIVFFSYGSTRLLAILTLPALAYYVLKTGSRSNMLTLVVVTLFSILVIPNRYRFRLVGALVVAAALVIPLMPRSAWNRLTTFTGVDSDDFTTSQEAEYERQAVSSTQARTQLQVRAAVLTVMNPIFGVGVRMFPDAVDRLVRATEGHKSGWQNPHNTYLQVSAETGIPGGILYIWCVTLCLRLNYRCYKQSLLSPKLSEFSLHSFALLLGCVIYAFDIFFCSIAYDYHLAVLIGFTAANHRAFQAAVASLRPAPAAPTPGAPRQRHVLRTV